MRGNPILRAVLLAVTLSLASLLVASLAGPHTAPAPAPANPTPSGAYTASPELVPSILAVTLSGPVRSLSFTEPSGREISIPTSGQLTALHAVDLAIASPALEWAARLDIEWEDPSRHHFARFDFEPRQLKTATLVLDFPGDVTGYPVTASFRDELATND